jgi:hypothetical protein
MFKKVCEPQRGFVPNKLLPCREGAGKASPFLPRKHRAISYEGLGSAPKSTAREIRGAKKELRGSMRSSHQILRPRHNSYAETNL